MHKLLTLLAAGALLATCTAVLAAPQTSAQDTAEVNVSIEKYGSVNIRNDVTMKTVQSDWFGQTKKTSGSSLVDVENNFKATLRVLKTLELVDGGSYDVDVEVALMPENLAYDDNGYSCIDFDPGEHTAATTLWIELEKHWTVADTAGTYTGTVTVELIEQ